MPSPVDTLKAMRTVADQLGLHSEERAALDAAIAAIDGGEAVAWQYRWKDAAWERHGGWQPCERHEYEAQKLDHNYPRPELEFRALYPAPRTAPDGMVLVPREPTPEMMEAANRAVNDSTYEVYPEELRAAWHAMLAAAQQSEAGPGAG